MSIKIPVTWLSYRDYNPARGRWDQMFLERILNGEEGLPPGGYQFAYTPWTPDDGQGRVIIFPCGSYAEHGEADEVATQLLADLNRLEWAVLIATSDEGQTFDWGALADRWPPHVKLWVQLPQPGRTYPAGTRFIGEGSPIPARVFAPSVPRTIDVFFSGQLGHERRVLAWNAMVDMLTASRLRMKIDRTPAFLHSLAGKVVSGPGADRIYVDNLRRSWVAPCPAGIESQSSFRFYEALEAGCIPVVDALSRHGNDGFWQMLGLAEVAPLIHYWRELKPITESLLVNRHETAANISSRWQRYKRELINTLHDDVHDLCAEREWSGPHDRITVIIPTSPVPSNPDLTMIQETVMSTRIDLPGAEILICCDGLREEQLDRADAYHEFLYELCQWTNTQFNVRPFVFNEHLHQSGMMHAILPHVRTEFVLYVEHDAPLVGTVPFADILETMTLCGLNSMRFLHEVAIPPGSEHLFLDCGDTDHLISPAPWRATIQWSQRPHLARTEWYRQVMADNFDPGARTFIEDVMHGVVQAGTYAGRKQAREAWNHWRMGVYAPEGSWKRSTHFDGRAGDPKLPMLMKYPDGVRPEGAPPEGWTP